MTIQTSPGAGAESPLVPADVANLLGISTAGRSPSRNSVPGEHMKLFSCGITLIAVLIATQFASAQRRLTPLPHPIGYPQHAPARTAPLSSGASPWTPLSNQPTFLVDGSSNPILLMDGSVLVQDAGFPDWWKLTPDESGNYVNGTWTQVASLPAGYSPLSLFSRVAGWAFDR